LLVSLKKKNRMQNETFKTHQCRENCGVCCITPSISSPIPGMPEGKAANTVCVNLSEDFLCKIFDKPNRPHVCSNFQFDNLICGNSREEAIKIMKSLE
jgi:Fe-S-cluster containining protein